MSNSCVWDRFIRRFRSRTCTARTIYVISAFETPVRYCGMACFYKNVSLYWDHIEASRWLTTELGKLRLWALHLLTISDFWTTTWGGGAKMMGEVPALRVRSGFSFQCLRETHKNFYLQVVWTWRLCPGHWWHRWIYVTVGEWSNLEVISYLITLLMSILL